MHLSWLGQTCVRLQTKYRDDDVVALLDAYRPADGSFPRSFSPALATFSRGADNAATMSQDPFVLDTLGEIELKEIIATGTASDEHNIIFKIHAEGLSVVHLGRLNKKPDLDQLEALGAIDILFVPVGGGEQYLDAADAAEIVTALEPRVVIPMGYQCDTDPKAKPLSEFIKELGLKPELTDKKIIIKKKDLPQEETKLYVLEKSA